MYLYIQEMFLETYEIFLNNYLWKIIESVSLVFSWCILAFLLYKFIMYLFVRFNLLDLINKIESKLSSGVKEWFTEEKKKKEVPKAITEKFKINEIVAKSISYYVFLLFFRMAISQYWVDDIETFMDELIRYLPKIFIWVMIWYLWIRFAKFVHDIILYAFGIKTRDTAKIVATGSRWIIIFFTVMAVLDQVGIATEVTTTILNWFIAMLALAGWLAFWLWWKGVAREILESFKK
jgi:hypothetical protein